MNVPSPDPLNRYLSLVMKAGARSKSSLEEMEGVPFLTISREAGAGAHTVAEALLELLNKEDDQALKGWQIFDQEICYRLMSNQKLRFSLNSLLTEAYHNEVEDYISQLLTRSTPQDTVYHELFKTIRTLALCGRAIIVGRGAACYTRDIRGGVHIRLVAPESDRIERLSKRFRLPHEKAQRMMETQDSSRRKMIRDFFKKSIEDPLLYDAVINTGMVPIGEAAAVALRFIKSRLVGKPLRSPAVT